MKRGISRGFLMLAAAVCAISCASGSNDRELFKACRDGNVEEARALLAAGANVNAADNDGFTPLTIASQQGHDDIVQLLRAAGAKN